jgi:CubicO group peptidase (beta-lactamase class C family)
MNIPASQAMTFLRDADPAELEQKLRKVLNPSQLVALHIISDRGVMELRTQSAEFDSDTPVAIGCVAKVIAAMLAAIAVRERLVSWTDPVSLYLTGERESPLFEHLGQVAIHQLLSHSHGLDATHIGKLAHTRDGFLDVGTLLFSQASAYVLARPGEIVNYGSVGSWLMAVILERRYSKPYIQLIEDKLLRPLGITRADPGPTDFCPANGTGILLSARSLGKLSRLFLASNEDPLSSVPHLGQLYGEFGVPLPIRPYAGKRMCLGLVDYGGGWIGQSGRSPSNSAVFRVSPQEGTSLIITSNQDRLSNNVMGGLFGTQMIDMRALRPPKEFLPAQAKTVQVEPYCGIYRNGRYTLRITPAGPGEACAEILDTPAGVANQPPPLVMRRTMRPAADNCFLATEPEPLIIGMIHFHGEGPNGEQMFARTATQVFARAPG